MLCCTHYHVHALACNCVPTNPKSRDCADRRSPRAACRCEVQLSSVSNESGTSSAVTIDSGGIIARLPARSAQVCASSSPGRRSFCAPCCARACLNAAAFALRLAHALLSRRSLADARCAGSARTRRPRVRRRSPLDSSSRPHQAAAVNRLLPEAAIGVGGGDASPSGGISGAGGTGASALGGALCVLGTRCVKLLAAAVDNRETATCVTLSPDDDSFVHDAVMCRGVLRMKLRFLAALQCGQIRERSLPTV